MDDDTRRQPNQYLRMMYRLSKQTRELLLLTATPMQMNEMELWALFGLLEPEGWNEFEYRRFYQDAEPDIPEWKFRRDLWKKSNPTARVSGILSSENDDYIESMLQDPAVIKQTMKTMEDSAPARRLMSRHTRQLLRRYREQGLLDAPIPSRQVRDTVITMTPEERELYERNHRSGAEVLRGPEHKPTVPGIHQDNISEEVRIINLRLRPDPQERG